MQSSRYAVTARAVEFRLTKAEAGWWARLVTDTTRQHWLRVDFLNWRDEDEQEEEKEAFEEVTS